MKIKQAEIKKQKRWFIDIAGRGYVITLNLIQWWYVDTRLAMAHYVEFDNEIYWN